MKLERIPYQKYEVSDFACQLDLTLLERNVLMKIHFLDKGDAFGCYALVGTLAEYLELSKVQVRGAIDRLRKKGYLAIMGFMPSGAACRRVQLKYAKLPGIKGASITNKEGERQMFRYRKTGEANPSICLRQDLQKLLGEIPQKMVTPPSPVMPHTWIDSGIKPYIPCKQGTDLSDDRVKTKNPGRRGKDWVAMFNALPESQQVLKAFNLTTITPAVARMVIKRLRHLSLTAILYLARNAVMLPPADEFHAARRFISFEDFLKRCVPIREYICAAKKDRLQGDLEEAKQVLADSLSTSESEMQVAKEHISDHECNTLDEFYNSGAHPRTMWYAAYHFSMLGEDVTVSEFWHYVGWSCVLRPAAFAFMRSEFRFDLGTIAGLTENEAFDLRADIDKDLNKSRSILASCPDIKELSALETALDNTTFFTDRVFQFLADGDYARICDRLTA
jgi:hypothetical protein